MKPATLALILVGVAGAGAGAYFLVIKRKKSPVTTEARDLAAAQTVFGAKAVQQGVPGFIAAQMGGAGVAQNLASGGASAAAVARGAGKSSDMSSPGAKQVFGLAGNVLDKYYPGLGSTAAGIAQKIDSKIGLGLISKVPGLKKLKFW